MKYLIKRVFTIRVEVPDWVENKSFLNSLVVVMKVLQELIFKLKVTFYLLERLWLVVRFVMFSFVYYDSVSAVFILKKCVKIRVFMKFELEKIYNFLPQRTHRGVLYVLSVYLQMCECVPLPGGGRMLTPLLEGMKD